MDHYWGRGRRDCWPFPRVASKERAARAREVGVAGVGPDTGGESPGKATTQQLCRTQLPPGRARQLRGALRLLPLLAATGRRSQLAAGSAHSDGGADPANRTGARSRTKRRALLPPPAVCAPPGPRPFRLLQSFPGHLQTQTGRGRAGGGGGGLAPRGLGGESASRGTGSSLFSAKCEMCVFLGRKSLCARVVFYGEGSMVI